MSVYDKYEVVVGLEVHAQLSTQSKAFCADSAEYGGAPNTHISPISLGHPGTLPYFNEAALDDAIKMGLACHSNITEVNQFSRKNYFYADLPKGYQITQFDTPICTGGYVEIELDGKRKPVNLTRIHLEEDAGKSTHDIDPYFSLIDLNRAGVPLIEIVTEPDIRSSDEAYAYLTEVRKLVRYLGICDGNLEEGSMRCDANVSVRLKGAQQYGQRTEVKNMNSIRNVKRAIDHEVKRQIDLIEKGDRIVMETRSFNATDGSTFSLRTKEEANDYRYFPEPDLPPIIVTEQMLNTVRAEMPELPKELIHKFTQQLGLSSYDARVLTDEKEVALFFNELIKLTTNYKAASNWVTVSVKSFLNENAVDLTKFPLTPQHIADLIKLIDDGKVSHTVASQRIFPELVKQPAKTPLQLAEEMNLIQESGVDFIQDALKKVLDENPSEVERYRAGDKKLTGFFMGKLMKATGGKADPKAANKLLMQLLGEPMVKPGVMDINKHIVDRQIHKIVETNPSWFEKLGDERQKLSKAFLCLSVSSYLDIELSEAISLITDGGNDAGVDAIYIEEINGNEFPVTIFQGKYVFDLEKESNFPANSVQKVVSSIGAIFDPLKPILMNKDLAPQVEEIRSLIADGNIPNINCVFTNNGHKWNIEAQMYIDNLLTGNRRSLLEFDYFNHSDIVQHLKSKKPVDAQFKLSGKSIQEDFNFKSVLVGKVNVSEIATLFDNHGDNLLEKNIRRYLGLNKSRVNVNQAIRMTLLSDKKDNFYFYNNGITMICTKFSYNALQVNDWIVKAENLQIINGGQSCKTIQHTLNESKDIDFSQVFVLVRLYELSGDSIDNIITDITIATNSQNPVDLRDLRANDDIQRTLQIDVESLGYYYKAKKDSLVAGDFIPSSVAAEAIYSIWKETPHQAKFKKNELFGKFYYDVFNNVNGAQLILAVLIFRFCDNQRRRTLLIDRYPHIPYSNYFMSMLVGTVLLNKFNMDSSKLNHNNFREIRDYFEQNKDSLFDEANLWLVEGLKALYPDGYDVIDRRRLAATFRRGDLMPFLKG